jgi:hypothetical protein
MRLRTGAWRAAVAVLCLAVGCVNAVAPAITTGPAVKLSGTILGNGQPFGQGLFEYELPGLRAHELHLEARPGEGVVGRGLDFLGAYWLDRGHALTFATGADGRRQQLFEASPSAAPRRIGPPLSFVSAFDTRGSWVVAATCRSLSGSLLLMDLHHPGAWLELGRSCLATLSPDATRVAFVRSETEIWERRVDGGPASKVLDVAQLPDIRAARFGRILINALTWGDGGLAIGVGPEQFFEGGRGQSAIVTRDSKGSVRVVPLPAQSLELPHRPWQPNGRLLAMIARPSSGGAVVRLFDPQTSRVWVVAADTQYFGNVAWSPDGHALVANTSTNALLFVDPQGNWIRRAGLGGVGLLDWGT